jgi:nucleoside-diphosphate-sugar epimerase
MEMNSRSQFAGQKAIVTGATGFIGSHLCARLFQSGAEVHAVSRSRNTKSNVNWWRVDLQDISSVRQLLRDIQPDLIFHLSGHVTAAPDLKFALSTFESHVVSTIYMLTAATEIGCRRIILTGSLTEPLNFAHAVPSSPYAAAKSTSGAYGRMFHALYGTPVTIVRPFMTYGPMQNREKIVPYVTRSLLRGEIPRLASGRWQADWIFIDDVIEGMLATARAVGVEGCTIDLGSGMLIPVREVVAHIVELVGATTTPSFGALPDRPGEEIAVADTDFAESKLGWKAKISLKEGLSRTVSWHRERLCAASLSHHERGELR